MLLGYKINRDNRDSPGFTLIELLVSLSVIGVAVSVYISLYSASLEIGDSARNRSIALGLAESQLLQVLLQPSDYHWEIPEPINLGRIAICQSDVDSDAGILFPIPSEMPPDRIAYKREKNIYEKFRWQAFAQLPTVESSHVRVTVVVHWGEGAKESLVALSSIVPRSKVEGLSP